MLVTVLEAVEMLRARLRGEAVVSARAEAEETVEWFDSTPPPPPPVALAEVAAAMAAVAAAGGSGLAAPCV